MTDAQYEQAMQSLAAKINGLELDEPEKRLLSQILTAAVDAATISAATEVLLRSREGTSSSGSMDARVSSASEPTQPGPETSRSVEEAPSSVSEKFASLSEQFVASFSPGVMEQIVKVPISVRVGSGGE